MRVLHFSPVRRVQRSERVQALQASRLACCMLVLSAALLGLVGAQSAAATMLSTTPSTTEPYLLCPPPTPEHMECQEIVEPAAYDETRAALGKISPQEEGTGKLGGWSPENLKHAYKLPEKGGSGETVAIVDAYNYPDAEADLNYYREYYGLHYNSTETACSWKNKCFKKINQTGGFAEENETSSVYPPAEPVWAKEMSLDMDMVSAICPECKILLVEADNEFKSEGKYNLVDADDEAATFDPVAISNSWAGPEESTEAEEDKYLTYPYIPKATAVVFAAGDYDYGAEYPSSSKYVISAGGTQLTKEKEPYKTERHWTEEVWHNEPYAGVGTAAGCSRFDLEPEWQELAAFPKACGKYRTDNDVSAVAYNLSAYDTYERTTEEERWKTRTGTSASTPIISAIEALSTTHARESGAQTFYLAPAKSFLYDITVGEDSAYSGGCAEQIKDEGRPEEDLYLCHAEVGYDGPTGNGTPDGPFMLYPPPIVTTGSATSITESGATLNGTVNPEGTETKYYFQYGTKEKELTLKTAEVSAGSGTTTVEVSKALTALTANTTYYYRLVASNTGGTNDGTEKTFETSGKPTVETKAATSIGETSAKLNGTVNPRGAETKYYFLYGTKEKELTLKTAEVSAGSGRSNVEVSKEIASLTRNTKYYFEIVATNLNGTVDGAELTFTTLNWVITGSATGITATEAVVHGTVNPHGLATTDQFEYGLTTSYGTTVPSTAESAGSGTTVVAKGYILTGLLPHTTYHFRVVGKNSEGAVDGKDATFTTSALTTEFVSSFGSFGTGNGEFDEPTGIGVNPINGDVVVSDEKNNRVQVFNEKGEFVRTFGTEGAGNGQFKEPRGVAVDSKGNIWVTDTGNDRVEEFNEKGEYLSQLGTKGTGNGQFTEPKGLAVDSKGNIWVADSANRRVEEFNEKREYVRQFAAGTNPIGVATESKDNVWTDNEDETGAIEEHSETGVLVQKFATRGEANGDVLDPKRLTIADGNVWVPDAGNDRVNVFNEKGEYVTKFGSYGTEPEEMIDPTGIAVDAQGRVWVADDENDRVDKWRITVLRPTFSSSFGSAGTGNGEFDEPTGIAVNPINGTVVVSDEKNNRVQEFSESGAFVRTFGIEGTGNGDFKEPRGVAVDSKGNIWVTDTGNDRIEEFNEKGEYLAQFGTKGTGNGDFTEPKGLAVDSKGNIWVADSGNARIQEFNEKREYMRQFAAGTNPIGVAVNSKGNVWTDNEDETGAIEEHSETGVLEQKFATRGEGKGQVLEPKRLSDRLRWRRLGPRWR